MERFFILCLTACHTETVFEVVNGFFYMNPDFIGVVPFFGASGSSGISAEALLRIDINHPSAGRGGAGIITMTDPMLGFICGIVFPFHFRAYKFQGWQSALPMRFASFPSHWK